MATDLTTPRCALFTRSQESPAVAVAAFDFLRIACAFSHEAVCNAVMAMESDDSDLVLASVRFIAAASCLARTNDRIPAITALNGGREGGASHIYKLIFVYAVYHNTNHSASLSLQ